MLCCVANAVARADDISSSSSKVVTVAPVPTFKFSRTIVPEPDAFNSRSAFEADVVIVLSVMLMPPSISKVPVTATPVAEVSNFLVLS